MPENCDWGNQGHPSYKTLPFQQILLFVLVSCHGDHKAVMVDINLATLVFGEITGELCLLVGCVQL